MPDNDGVLQIAVRNERSGALICVMCCCNTDDRVGDTWNCPTPREHALLAVASWNAERGDDWFRPFHPMEPSKKLIQEAIDAKLSVEHLRIVDTCECG